MRSVESAQGGYIVLAEYGQKRVYKTLEEVFADLLQGFEGRAAGFGGEMYGVVRIERERRGLPNPPQGFEWELGGWMGPTEAAPWPRLRAVGGLND